MRCDVIVVGSGVGGATVAKELSALGIEWRVVNIGREAEVSRLFVSDGSVFPVSPVCLLF